MVLKDLRERLEQLRTYYSTLHARQREDDDYYRGKFTITMPAAAHKSIPSTCQTAVDVPKDHLVSDKPVVKRRRESAGKREKGHDDKVEAFLQAWLQEQEQDSLSPPLHDAVKLQIGRGGVAIVGPFYNREQHERGEPGYAYLEVWDMLNVFVDPGQHPRSVFLELEYTVAEFSQEARRDTRLSNWEREGRGADDRITVVRWWGYDDYDDKDGKAVEFAAWETTRGDFIAEPRPSGYDYIPVDIIPSGWGIDTPGAKPEDIFVSIYTKPIRSMIESEALAYSQCESAMGTAAWARYEAQDAASAAAAEIHLEAGTISIMPAGVRKAESEALPVASVQFLSIVDKQLERGLFSGVIQGSKPEGVNTVGQTAILSGQARLRFGSPLRQMKAGIARVLYKMGQLIATVEELAGKPVEFSCRGRTVTAADFGGDYTVQVELPADDPEERNIRITNGIRLDGKIPRKVQSEEYFGRENFEEDLEQQVYENVVLSAEFTQGLTAFIGLQQAAQAKDMAMVLPPNQQGGGLEELQAQAALMRASRPGGIPQTPPMPGSPEAMAAGAQGMVAAPGIP